MINDLILLRYFVPDMPRIFERQIGWEGIPLERFRFSARDQIKICRD